MNAYEKGKLMKSAIFQLYENEGRSISYISRLLLIDRKTISTLIKEWDFHQNNQEKRKIQEFLAQYKEFILARIKDGWNQRQIYTSCKVGRIFFLKVIDYDADIANAFKNMTYKDKEYCEPIDGEIWKPILGYPNYEVSNYGRVRNKYGLMKQTANVKNGYLHVMLHNNGERKNFRTHRLVAHSFCNGYTEEKNNVNHIDGNITNNKADNLEWVTPSENLQHSYDTLNRVHKGGRALDFTILYKNKYEFKTISSFARFVDISPTQASRWVYESPSEHDIKIIPKK